jgi:endonuclease YncB( thermonuclease family)
MRIITMALITLVTGLSVIGLWVVLGPGAPSFFNLGSDSAKKITRRKDKRRSSPYVILVPAETLPEKVSSAPAKPALTKKAPLITSSLPSKTKPAEGNPSPASKPEKAPAKKPTPVAKSNPIAKQTLDAILGPSPEPKPVVTPEATPKKTEAPKPALKQPASLVSLEPKKPSIPVQKTKPAALTSIPAAPSPALPVRKPEKKVQQDRELTYAVKTKRQAGERNKKHTFKIGEKNRFRRVVPLGSGRLEVKDSIIVLAGVDALRANSECQYASGKSWDCGRWGKYALRRFIRGRAVVCDVIEELSETEVSANCEVAGRSINKWVVRRGWGQPSAENANAYAAELSTAKKDKVGLWSNEPKAAPQRAELPPEPPVSETALPEIPVTGLTITEIPLSDKPPAQTQTTSSN